MAVLRRQNRKGNENVVGDISLDQEYIVFQGAADEALGAYLSGSLSILFKEPVTVTHIRLNLCGVRKLSVLSRAGLSRKRVSKKEEFYKHTWTFLEPVGDEEGTEKVMRGEFEYPFHVVLEGSMLETVEGLKDSSVAYSLTAEIVPARGKVLTVKKPLRIVRVPKQRCTDVMLDQIWSDKLAYRVNIPNRLVAFGASIYLDCSFAPLLKDLKIQFVESQLLEIKDLNSESGLGRNVAATNVISSDRYYFEANDPGAAIQGEYRCCRRLGLPMLLGSSVQDVDIAGIRVTHKLRVVVRMHNPDGHHSEVRLTVPVTIYLSPSWPVWHDASIALRMPRPQLLDCDEAPPPYGKHELDRLYGSTDQSIID